MSVKTSRTKLTYGDCLPRPNYHQFHCRADVGAACACNDWWRSREYIAQWNALGYTRIDSGPPYDEELPPDD